MIDSVRFGSGADTLPCPPSADGFDLWVFLEAEAAPFAAVAGLLDAAGRRAAISCKGEEALPLTELAEIGHHSRITACRSAIE